MIAVLGVRTCTGAMSQWMTELCEGLGSEGGTRGPQEGEDPRGPGRAGRGREDEKTSGEETRARAGPGPTESAFLSSSMTLKGAAASLGIGTFASSVLELRAASTLSFPPFSVAALAESLVTLPKANLLRRFPVGGLSAGFAFTFASSVLVVVAGWGVARLKPGEASGGGGRGWGGVGPLGGRVGS